MKSNILTICIVGVMMTLGSSIASAMNLVCATNGESGSATRYIVFDQASGAAYGAWTSLRSCENSLTSERGGYLCLSVGYNANHPKWERFWIYSIDKDRRYARAAVGDSCFKSLHHANSRGTTCVSNGQTGSLEEFSMFSLRTGQYFGDWYKDFQCFRAIPN